MISYPSFAEIREGLGDKFLESISVAVAKTKRDHLEYRQSLPRFAAAASVLGWAVWLHDRMWDNFVAEVADLPGVQFREEPTHEIFVGLGYRVHVKRHDFHGGVVKYPTKTALRFLRQQQPTLDGITEVGLCIGYTWDKVMRSMKDPIISLPKDRKLAAWWEVLPEAERGEEGGDSGAYILRTPSQPGPVAPMIDIPGNEQSEDKQA